MISGSKQDVLEEQLSKKHSDVSVADISYEKQYSDTHKFDYRIKVELNDKFTFKFISYKISWKSNSSKWRLHEQTSTGWN